MLCPACDVILYERVALLCLHRDCTLKVILQEIVRSYVENAPELKREEK